MRRILPLLLIGCAQAQVDVYSPDAKVEHAEILSEAGEILGIRLDLASRRRGVPTLEFIRGVGPGPRGTCGVAGRAYRTRRCIRSAWSNPDPIITAHEMGHILGLDHSDDEDNLMHLHASSTWLEPWQIDVMEKNAGILEMCQLERLE